MNKSGIRFLLLQIFFLLGFALNAQQVKILFDDTKAETANNTDWIIDADAHNLGWNPNASLNGGSESNAQQTPLPAQSNIISSTSETYWSGALSSWGIDCVKRGYAVETLPYNGAITYNNSSNNQDLSKYKIFVVCEPNIRFTTTEKSAIIAFVQNGGSLYMISDHTQSDRNNDGWDSPAIWNDLLSGSGITFNLTNISFTNEACATIEGIPFLNLSLSIQVFPNPTYYEITLIGIEEESQIFLINILNEKQKLSEVSNSHHYNICDFAPGIYQIVINQKALNYYLVKRLVIQ